MAIPWSVVIASDADGGFSLTVWPLADFVMFAETRDELERDWRDALRSHLEGYLACGKAIPTGRLDVSIDGESRGASQLPTDEYLAV